MADMIWLALMVLFLIAEAGTVTMVSLWFAGGALTALIAALLGAPVLLQIVLFFAVSGVLLACLRPLAKKYFTPRVTKTNAESVIGSEGYVTRQIDNLNAQGQVKLSGMEWTARSQDGSVIPEGTRIRVIRIEGVKVFVIPADRKV